MPVVQTGMNDVMEHAVNWVKEKKRSPIGYKNPKGPEQQAEKEAADGLRQLRLLETSGKLLAATREALDAVSNSASIPGVLIHGPRLIQPHVLTGLLRLAPPTSRPTGQDEGAGEGGGRGAGEVVSRAPSRQADGPQLQRQGGAA